MLDEELSEKAHSPALQKVFIRRRNTAIRVAEANKMQDKLKLEDWLLEVP